LIDYYYKLRPKISFFRPGAARAPSAPSLTTLTYLVHKNTSQRLSRCTSRRYSVHANKMLQRGIFTLGKISV